MKKLIKVILGTAILLAIMNVTIIKSANAESRVLTVPGQYWNDGNPRPTLHWVFFDNPYYPYDSHAQCAMAARQLHAAKISPNYSACTTEYTAARYR